MRFNLAYFGLEMYFHIRRDFLLAVKYGLESLGHDVILGGLELDTTRFNLVVGAYFLPPEGIRRIQESGVQYAHINTEVISGDMLNYNPKKVDFLGAYLPSMRGGKFIWDVIQDNLAEHHRYGNTAHFLRWGWHPKLEDIEHRAKKDLDFYIFGLMTPRRVEVVKGLRERKFFGVADGSCPYFLRNDRIARARVNLNVIQDPKYTHVNCFRICYLANNRAAILSEAETDPARYLDVARLVHSKEEIAEALADLLAGDKWKALGDAGYEKFRQVSMARCMEELLDASFASGARAPEASAAGGAR